MAEICSETTRPPTVIRLIGSDPSILDRVESLIPDGPGIERFENLSEATPRTPPFALTVYCVDRFDENAQRDVAAFISDLPRRIAVVCREVEAGDAFEWGMAQGGKGLIAVENDRSAERLAERLARWYWGGVITPEWRALGAPLDRLPRPVEQLHDLIARRPFRDWRVAEVARELAISARTLNRAVQSVYDRSLKQLLQDVRLQMVEGVRAASGLSGEEIATLFEFPSVHALYEWRRRLKR